MSERIFEVKSEKGDELGKLVESLSAFYGGVASATPVILIRTDNDEIANMLRIILKNEITEFGAPPSVPPQMPAKTAGHLEREGKATRIGTRMKETGWERENRIRRETEARKLALAEGRPHKFCRNCFERFMPMRANAIYCSHRCSNQYTVRRIHYQNSKQINIDKMYSYRASKKVIYFTEEEFTSKLKGGGFPEEAKVLTPEGWLRVIRFQAGNWTFDEMRPSPEEVGGDGG